MGPHEPGAYPRTGGLYVFIREGWGRLTAFCFGWAEPVLIRAASLGAISTTFAEYFLRTEGYLTTIVRNGDDITGALADHRPDLLVLDLMISGGAGLALCRQMRGSGSLPILAVSAVASGDAALEAGADAFLQKPVQPLQFVSTVRDLLGTSAFLRRTGTVR